MGRTATPGIRVNTIGALLLGSGLAWLAAMSPAAAASPVSCGGAVMLNAAALMCSHLNPQAPPQLCTYSWSLLTTDGKTKVASGSFLLQPGATNLPIYQANGFLNALSPPIVMCQRKPAGQAQ